MFHYPIASLKNEVKDLISNLHITNENFLVAQKHVTQSYNNTRLIAMINAKHLCQMPQVKKGDATSMRQIINHVSSYMNTLQALILNVPTQDLMVNHLMLATIDPDTQQEWEFNTATHEDTPTTEEFIAFLESRFRDFELLQTTQSLKADTVTPRLSQSDGTRSVKHFIVM
jgi:hypothetical protein